MIRVYLTYGKQIVGWRGTDSYVIEAGEERHLLDYHDPDLAATVVKSWLLDPDTLGVRLELRPEVGG